MKVKGKKGYQVYELNPSLMSMSDIEWSAETKLANIKEYEGANNNQKIVVIDEAIIDGKYRIKDNAKFFKIFTSFDFSKLSKPSLSILSYIFKKLQPNKDIVQIHPKLCMADCGWGSDSRAMFYRGLSGLLDNSLIFIKTGSDNEYFINVNMIFNGKRQGLYQKNIIMGDEEHKQKLIQANSIMLAIQDEQKKE